MTRSGIGLRPKHYRDFLEGAPRVDFVEAISENFMGLGGRPLAVLEQARRERPVFLHGVSLGVASVDPPDVAYLRALKALVQRVEPEVVSDHLCWGRAHGRFVHDLLPVPFTREAVALTVERVQQVQEHLGRQLALENVSSYLTFAQSELTEWGFLCEVVARSGCAVLLDVNNVYVSAQNHGFDPVAYLEAIPPAAVVQLHLGGHQRRPEVIIDTHDGPVSDDVWALFAHARHRFPHAPVCVEWDDAVPPLEVLLAEAERARAVVPTVLPRGATTPPARVEPGPPLAQTQALVVHALCAPEPVRADAAALVHPHGALTGRARLELYADMYWLRLRDTLRDVFPITRLQLGDEAFDARAMDLVRTTPSTHYALEPFARHFVSALRVGQHPLTDLAALEWARLEAFTALDAPVCGLDALEAVPADAWGAVTLTAHPAVRLLRCEVDPLPTLRDGAPPGAGPVQVVVWRHALQAFHARVSAEEAAALACFLAGAPLLEVLAPFADSPDPGAAALQALHSWFNEGMVSAVASRAA